MAEHSDPRRRAEGALTDLVLPVGISFRAWAAADFPAIQRLSSAEGWPTPVVRPDEALAAWRNSWPALVALAPAEVVGFVRALSDGEVTMYVAELLVARAWRGRGIGRALLDACHLIYPHTRIDLLSTESADRFYAASGFGAFRGFRKSYR
jgi:GNAT superfamily N-acetyltransferase